MRAIAALSRATRKGSEPLKTYAGSTPRLELDRRTVLTSAATLTAGAGVGAFATATPVAAQAVDEAELMKPMGLDELAIGPEDAKVTIIEYASMSCGHCKRFHESVYPELKKKYVDTGKVRFIFREFPLDNRAAAASMLARCVGGNKSLPMISVLFEQQKDWAYVQGNPVPKLFEIAKQAGFTEDSFNKCLEDKDLLAKLTKIRERGSSVFGVNSTPTFFINGQRLKGGGTLEDFEKIIDPLLAKS